MLKPEICLLCKKAEYGNKLVPLAKNGTETAILEAAVSTLCLHERWFCPAKTKKQELVSIDSEVPSECPYRLEQILK